VSGRLQEKINRRLQSGQKLFSIFVTAGFPKTEATVDIVLSLDKAGVDFIELGVPFSDPIADGPVIQQASARALANGISLGKIFSVAADIRQHSQIPLILMGYLNPFLQLGLEESVRLSHECGVDGWIIPDWTLNESRKMAPLLAQNDLELIQLIAPNTPAHRIREIDRESHAFVYCTAYTGVTGKDNRPTAETRQFFQSLKKLVRHPVVIGFGIKSHSHVRTYGELADGVVIGSDFLRFISDVSSAKLEQKIGDYVHLLRFGKNK